MKELENKFLSLLEQNLCPKYSEKRMIIFKFLYGLKTSSARFYKHSNEKLEKIGYIPSKAYLDLWIKKNVDHMRVIAQFVDDVISFSKDPISVINELKKVICHEGSRHT